MHADKDMIRMVIEMHQNQELDAAGAGKLLRGLTAREDDVAVIGIGCKTPLSDNYHTVWDLISQQGHNIHPCPQSRIDLLSRFMGDGGGDEKAYHQGAILGDIGMFDHNLFQFSKKEASVMDPAQRLMLTAAYRAIENAGYLGERNKENDTAVYIGTNFSNRQYINYISLLGTQEFENFMLNLTSGVATRVSNVFDLRGISTVIENSCVASSIAIYRAYRAVSTGEAKMALAGGMNMVLVPDVRNSFNEVFAHGRYVVSKPYDRNPGGNYISEGAAAILLKPLKQALQDGDQIHGILKGGHINNNGRRSDFLQSSIEAISQAVADALADAGVHAEDIEYVEGEGYCEKLEQALEVKGLDRGFRQFTKKRQYCALGAASVNLGYSEASVGVFNTICCLLAMKNKQIPPIYSFTAPSDLSDICDSPFYINDQLTDWETSDGRKRTSAIFTQGFGGGNAFLVFQEAPQADPIKPENRKQIFTISGKSKKSFDENVENMMQYLENAPAVFEDICFTASAGRFHHREYRAAAVADTPEALIRELRRILKDGGRYVKQDGNAKKNHALQSSYDAEKEQIKTSRNLEKLAEYYCLGADITFVQFFSSSAKITELPLYHFDASLCWL